MNIIDEALEGRYEFTIDDATGTLSFQHPIMVMGLTTHQVRALADFYGRLTGDDPRREGFCIGTAREHTDAIQRKLAGLPPYSPSE